MKALPPKLDYHTPEEKPPRPLSPKLFLVGALVMFASIATILYGASLGLAHNEAIVELGTIFGIIAFLLLVGGFLLSISGN